MSPSPQETVPQGVSPGELHDDDIVITGLSGIFPDSNNVQEFAENLYNKVNMIKAEPRWDYNHPEVSEYAGNVPNLDKFDAQFFMIHYRLADSMDCMPKKLMENAYQAIYDAGINPVQLSGSKVGVFIGAGISESEKVCCYSAVGFGIVGCNRAMFANRISYWLNGRGPSLTVDAACAGSMVALTKAYQAIKAGECESAVVGGASIHLHPQTYVHYGRLLQINPDGKTKCFDKNADGCSQSEAISVLFLQKYKDAKRVYAKLCHAKNEYRPFTDEVTGMPLGLYRPVEISTAFLKKFYTEAAIPPSLVEYVETLGIANLDSDKSELQTIENVFCDELRKKQVVVGSVTSNMGFADVTSGAASLTKVCLGFQEGKMAGNLHCDNPRDDIAALRDGRMKIATDHTPIDRTYVAINNMSVTGNNVHALLQGLHKKKNLNKYLSPIPHLVTISGRQEASVKKIINDLKSRPIDPEEIALFHNIHKLRISKHMGRGFAILDTNDNKETISISEKVDYYDDAKRPLWFVYSGMGSQWTEMGAQLMRIPIFASAIQRCHDILKPKGVNLIHILTSNDKTIYDNILHSFVGIAAVQIGLTDVLKSIGIVPDKIIGHSVGELGCAYADGCLTAEEMILSAYSRGLVSVQTPFIKGSMAAVGLGFKQIKSLCPPEIEVACHNSAESCTISGPADAMKVFVDQLTKKGVFAKEVPCSNIAYHSRYIKNAGPGLLKYLSDVIKTPAARTEKWVSTSVPLDKWEEPFAKLSSAEYHTNNLLSPVLFEETSRLIPANAVVVEIAPHGLLQAILKRSLPNCIHVPLTRRGHSDNVVYLLEALGTLFMQGCDIDLSALYPKIDFPVSTGTRGLSHLVDWVYTESWGIPLFKKAKREYAAAADFYISLNEPYSHYLKGHALQGEIYYPASGILTCVWDTLAMLLETQKRNISVSFHEVNFLSLPKLTMTVTTPLKLCVEIHKGTGKFEVTNDMVLIANGTIITVSTDKPLRDNMDNNEAVILADDVYRILYEKGYEYHGEFRTIHSTNTSLNRSQILWTGNWITFLDGILQTEALRRPGNALAQVSYIHELTVDIKRHINAVTENTKENLINLEAHYYEMDDITLCGGVIVRNVRLTDKPTPKRHVVTMKCQMFKPFFLKDTVDIPSALYMFLGIIAENVRVDKISAVEICDPIKESISSRMNDKLDDFKINIHNIDKTQFVDFVNQSAKLDVVLLNNALLDRKLNEEFYQKLPQETFMIILEESCRSKTFYRVVSSATTSKGRMVLAKWIPRPTIQKPATVVSVASTKDILLLHAMRQKMQDQDKLTVLTLYPPFNGLKDFIKKYRMEPQRNNICLAMVDEKNYQNMQGKHLPDFDFAYNVLSKGTWGTELYFPSEDYSSPNSDVILRSPKDGNTESLQWVEAQETKAQDKIGVTVHFAGLSYLDSKKATGEAITYSDDVHDYTYGMDFSGMTKNGERVMGLLKSGSAASHVQADPLMMWPVPAHWSLEDAATVPLAYAHAFYCLAIKNEFYRGMSILVHGAAGGLGQAVISIGLAHGCKVYATVSDMKKKRLLRKLFPELPEEHIGNSRDNSFVDLVLNLTDAKGCDIVISCLKGSLANAPLDCVADYGVMLDTHSLHSRDKFHLGMYCLTRSRSYKAIDFSSIFTYDNKEEMQMIQLMVSEGIASGYVRPLARVSYGWNQAQRAVRLLASSKHRGRVLLHLRGPSPHAYPTLKFSPSGSILVISEDEDSMLTVRLAELLVSRGAKNIALHFNRSKLLGEGHLKMKIRAWQQENGVKTFAIKEKVTKKEHIETKITEAKKMGNVEAIFVIATAPDEDSETHLVSMLNYLDEISTKMCPSLKYFAVITETSEFAQQICLKRSLETLPATMIRLTSIEKYNELGSQTVDTLKFDWQGILEALERGIYASHTSALAQPKPMPQISLVDELSKIPGVYIKIRTPGHTTLKQIGLDENGADKLLDILETKFNTSNIPRENILELTLSQIIQIQEKVSMVQKKDITGFWAFFPELNTDELLTNTSTVLLPTLVQSSVMRVDEFDNTQTYLVMIPGLDGLHTRFLTLAQRLKLPALALQPGLDHLHETIQQTAERLTKVVIKTLKPKEKFYLLGYSSGVLIALEMAVLLEQQGLEGVVYCVDADPETFPAKMMSYLRTTQEEDQLSNSLIKHMYSLMTGEDPTTQLDAKLIESPTWKEKMEVILKAIKGKVTLSKQYAQNTIESVYARINQTRAYDGQSQFKQKPLKSPLVLMKTDGQFAAETVLEKYTSGALHVYDIKTDHARALEDLNCTNIINMHLDKEILDAFDRRNLCTSYLLNADRITA